MGIMTKIGSIFKSEVKSTNLAESSTLIEILGLGDAGWSEYNYINMSKEGYGRNPVAYRCIKLIADSVSTLPWKVYDKDGDVVDDSNNYLVQLINRPNPEQGLVSFLYLLELYKYLDGNTFIESVGNGKELYILRPDRVEVVPGAFRIPKGYRYQGGRVVYFEVDQVTGESDLLHIHTENPLDDWRGMSPLKVAMNSVDLFNTGVTWNQKLLKNGARPLGMFSTDQELTNSQREELKLSLGQYVGAVNSGKPIVTEGGLSFQSIGLSVVDADFINGKESASTDIANVFGVPPQLVGLTKSSTFNNVKEAKLELYEQVILPEADLIVSEMNNWFKDIFGDEFVIGYDVDEISALIPRRTEKWDRITKATFLTDNEKRELLGLKIRNEDEITTNTNKE